jgi:hypothetical protein
MQHGASVRLKTPSGTCPRGRLVDHDRTSMAARRKIIRVPGS